MGRPEKQGIDYFSHDINSDNDQRLEYIEAVHGITGYGIYFKLLEKIYANGYFLQWTNRDQTLFSRKINVDINLVNVIINDFLAEGLIHKPLFEQYQIFTSQGIQKRYFHAIERRKSISLIREYLLITPVLNIKSVIVYINPVNVDINPLNERRSTHTIVKDTIVKDSREGIVKGKLKLTDEEWLESLKSNPAYANLDILIVKGKCEAWCNLNGKKLTRARLLNWLNREDKPLSGGNNGNTDTKHPPYAANKGNFKSYPSYGQQRQPAELPADVLELIRQAEQARIKTAANSAGREKAP